MLQMSTSQGLLLELCEQLTTFYRQFYKNVAGTVAAGYHKNSQPNFKVILYIIPVHVSNSNIYAYI